MEIHPGAWDLDLHRGELYWDNCSLVELARQYGTPLYVIHKKRLLEGYTAFVDAFSSAGLEAAVFYSFKTNPVPALLTALIQQGCGAEVISEYEFWLAQKLGLTGDQIIVNGTVKSPTLLRQAIEADAKLINIENEQDLHQVREITRQADRPVNIGLRINPGLKRSWIDFTTMTGSRSSPMGFVPGSEAWHHLLDFLREDDVLRVRAVHFHIGSGINKARPYKQALTKALQVWGELRGYGFQPEAIDMGGGFAVPSVKTLNLWEAIRLFGWGKPVRCTFDGEPNPLLGKIGEICARAFQELARRDGAPVPELFLEPGRALSASSQLLLLTVQGIVERRKRPPVVICDGGSINLSISLLSEQHMILAASHIAVGGVRPYDIMGIMPMNLDVVALRQTLPPLSPGDVLAVMDTGAYFTSLGNTFAGPRPGIVMLEDAQPKLVRRRETFQGLIARDDYFST